MKHSALPHPTRRYSRAIRKGNHRKSLSLRGLSRGGKLLPLGPCRWHLVNESIDLRSELWMLCAR